MVRAKALWRLFGFWEGHADARPSKLGHYVWRLFAFWEGHADARRRLLAAWCFRRVPSAGTGCSGSRAKRWRRRSSRARRSANRPCPRGDSDRTRRERVRERCALSLASRAISTSRHRSVRRSGASGTRRRCAERPVREARRVAHPKWARPDRTSRPSKWGSLRRVALAGRAIAPRVLRNGGHYGG